METSQFEKLAPKLHHTALEQCRGMGIEGDDIAQEVMLKLWEMRHDLDRIRSLPALTRVMARNMALNQHRRNKTLIYGALPEEIIDTTASPDELLENEEDAAWLERRINSLPATEYTILHLRQVEQKSIQEIASLLNLTDRSVSTLLSKARRKLYIEFQKRHKS